MFTSQLSTSLESNSSTRSRPHTKTSGSLGSKLSANAPSFYGRPYSQRLRDSLSPSASEHPCDVSDHDDDAEMNNSVHVAHSHNTASYAHVTAATTAASSEPPLSGWYPFSIWKLGDEAALQTAAYMALVKSETSSQGGAKTGMSELPPPRFEDGLDYSSYILVGDVKNIRPGMAWGHDLGMGTMMCRSGPACRISDCPFGHPYIPTDVRPVHNPMSSYNHSDSTTLPAHSIPSNSVSPTFSIPEAALDDYSPKSGPLQADYLHLARDSSPLGGSSSSYMSAHGDRRGSSNHTHANAKYNKAMNHVQNSPYNHHDSYARNRNSGRNGRSRNHQTANTHGYNNTHRTKPFEDTSDKHHQRSSQHHNQSHSNSYKYNYMRPGMAREPLTVMNKSG